MIALRNALMANQTLEVLRLVGTGVTSEGAVAIAEVLPENRSLRVIDLRDTAIDLGGLVALAVSMKHNQTLCALHVTAPRPPPTPPPVPPRRASVSNGSGGGGGGSSAPSSRRSSVSAAAAAAAAAVAAPAPPVGPPSAAAPDSAAPASAPPLPPKDGSEDAAAPLADAPAPQPRADGPSAPPTPAPATVPAATATLAMTAPGADHVVHFLSELATQCQANQLRNQWTPVHLQTLARMAGFIPITAISFRGNAMLIGPEAATSTPASTTPSITPAAIPPSEAGFFSSEYLPSMATTASGSTTPAVVAATVVGGGSSSSAVAGSSPPRPPDIAALLEQMDLAGLRAQALVRTVDHYLAEEASGNIDVETAYYVEVSRHGLSARCGWVKAGALTIAVRKRRWCHCTHQRLLQQCGESQMILAQALLIALPPSIYGRPAG